MAHARQTLGAWGEVAAQAYLERLGYEVLQKNWHAGRYGEIDLVAVEAGQLVVVEVKTRRGLGFGRPEEAVTRAKQAKLRGAAQAFVLAHPHLPQAVRFEVVAVVRGPDDQVQDLRHFRNLTFFEFRTGS